MSSFATTTRRGGGAPLSESQRAVCTTPASVQVMSVAFLAPVEGSITISLKPRLENTTNGYARLARASRQQGRGPPAHHGRRQIRSRLERTRPALRLFRPGRSCACRHRIARCEPCAATPRRERRLHG